MIAFRGQKKVEPRPDWSRLGVNSKFPTSIPAPFIREFSPGTARPFSHCMLGNPDSGIGESFGWTGGPSGSRKHFACGIQNPGLWNPEYSSRNSESKFGLQILESSTWNGASTAWNPESKVVLDFLSSPANGNEQCRIQGKARGPPPLFLDQTEARRADKIIFWDHSPPFFSGSGWPPPPPPYLKVWIRHWWKQHQKSRFCPTRNLTGTICYWSVILRRFSVVSNSAKRDANGFFKVLLLSSHLLNSWHLVRKSKFGTCAVTGYCSIY